MKRLLTILLAIAAFTLLCCGCGKEPIDESYTNSSIVISSFTEITGEKHDDLQESKKAYRYTYKIKNDKVGAEAYNQYKDYLNENFTYSMIDSTIVADSYCAVYYAADEGRIEYTETVDKSGDYTITVSVPK